MTVVVQLSPETEAVLRPVAERRGIDLATLVAEFAEKEATARHQVYPFPPREAAVAQLATATSVAGKLAAFRELQEMARQWNLPALPPSAYERYSDDGDEEK